MRDKLRWNANQANHWPFAEKRSQKGQWVLTYPCSCQLISYPDLLTLSEEYLVNSKWLSKSGCQWRILRGHWLLFSPNLLKFTVQLSGQEASFLGFLSRDPSLMWNTVNYVSPWPVLFQLMRSFLRSPFVHAITVSHFITNISWLVFRYPVVADLFPDVIEHKMFGKPFGLLIFEDGSSPWRRLRRTLPEVQTFAGPCCSSFFMFRVVDFFSPASSETTSHVVNLLRPHSRLLSGIVSNLLRPVEMLPGLYSIELHCAFLLCIISYVISARKLKTWSVFLDAKAQPITNGYFLLNEHGDLSFWSRYFNLPIALFIFKRLRKKYDRKMCYCQKYELAHHSRA